MRAEERISFHAGSHATAVRVDRAAWETAAGIRYGSRFLPQGGTYAERN